MTGRIDRLWQEYQTFLHGRGATVYLSPLGACGAEPFCLRVLDRSLIGADWLRPPFAEAPANRLVLFGIKGGVGRSTAGAVLAWRLAQAGKRIVIIDLDLESPGVGTTLLSPDQTPDFGIVDWFVEDAVGQADPRLLHDMVGFSPLVSGPGEILVFAAGGRPRPGYSYLPKLARAYAEVGTPGRQHRLRRPTPPTSSGDREGARP
ncbi:MAG: P-loop NTPase [Thermodesulfobacteriota bacterium]